MRQVVPFNEESTHLLLHRRQFSQLVELCLVLGPVSADLLFQFGFFEPDRVVGLLAVVQVFDLGVELESGCFKASVCFLDFFAEDQGLIVRRRRLSEYFNFTIHQRQMLLKILDLFIQESSFSMSPFFFLLLVLAQKLIRFLLVLQVQVQIIQLFLLTLHRLFQGVEL